MFKDKQNLKIFNENKIIITIDSFKNSYEARYFQLKQNCQQPRKVVSTTIQDADLMRQQNQSLAKLELQIKHKDNIYLLAQKVQNYTKNTTLE